MGQGVVVPPLCWVFEMFHQALQHHSPPPFYFPFHLYITSGPQLFSHTPHLPFPSQPFALKNHIIQCPFSSNTKQGKFYGPAAVFLKWAEIQ